MHREAAGRMVAPCGPYRRRVSGAPAGRSEEHTSELQSLRQLVCRLLREKKKEFNAAITSLVERGAGALIIGVSRPLFDLRTRDKISSLAARRNIPAASLITCHVVPSGLL